MSPPTTVQKKKRILRARGHARRKKLIDAATELLTTRQASEVSFRDIYELAEVPPGSAYHFFDNLEAVHLEVMVRFRESFGKALSAPFTPTEVSSWTKLTNTLISRAAKFYEATPAARQAYMGTMLPQGTITEENFAIGKLVEKLFNTYFKLPELENREMVFLLFPKIVNLIFAVSEASHGEITDEFQEEATTAGIGYLKMYLPEKLVSRRLKTPLAQVTQDDQQ